MKKLEKEIISLLKSYNKQYGVLTESKIKVLIEKLGMSEENAKILDEYFGPLSVWMANKIGEYYKTMSMGNETTNEVLKRLNFRGDIFQITFRDLRKYIVWGLNGNISSIKDLKLDEIHSMAIKWIRNLGSGEINYIEKNPILIDFRDKNGDGYYWVDLETNESKEECDRMEHCGKSSSGSLYSLRSYKTSNDGKVKINKSHLTASVSNEGTLYQLKGPKNSKPKEEYHKYIISLFELELNGEYFIDRIDDEYESSKDFKLEDLSLNELKELYEIRPELFKSIGLKHKMAELGIEIDYEMPETEFNVDIHYGNINNYIKNDVLLNVKRPNSIGQLYLSEIVLDSVYDEMLSDWIMNEFLKFNLTIPSWKSILDYYVYNGTKSNIRRLILLNDNTTKDIEKQNLVKLIIESSISEDIIEVLKDSFEFSFHDLEPKYGELLHQSLIETLAFYGEIDESDDYSLMMSGDLKNLVQDITDVEVLNVYEKVERDYGSQNTSIVFRDLVMKEIIKKPIWNKPKVSDLTIDEDVLNDNLNELLDNIEKRLNDGK
jgi:hypothetical protein